MSQAAIELRRSCSFCRHRKMRCSGETPWCRSCKERAQPCLYEASIPRARPRRQVDPAMTFPFLSKALAGPSAPTLDFFGGLLDCLFRVLWEPQTVLSVKHQTLITESHQATASSEPVVLPFDGTLMLMFYETAEMLVDKISPLGRALNHQQRRPRFIEALSRDSTQFMFDEDPTSCTSDRDLIKGLEQQRILDLIDFAFTHHPFLGIICSKTLFLRDYNAETLDSCLLHVVLGEALSLMAIKAKAEHGAATLSDSELSHDAFVSEAIALLSRKKRLGLGEDEMLRTMQSVVLLAWHMLYTGRIKRSIVLFGIATDLVRRVVAEREFDSTWSARVNGISTDDLAEEVLFAMHWIVQSATLWASLHLDLVISDLFGPTIQGYYPPLDLKGSKVWTLDVISGSISAVGRQAKTTARVRILSHGYGLASSIFSILLADGLASASSLSQGRPTWRSTTVMHQLHACLPRILEEARSAVPETHKALEGYVAVQTYHELLALRILFEAPSMRDPSRWPAGKPIDRDAVLQVIEISKSLVGQAVQITSIGGAAPDESESPRDGSHLHREELLYSTGSGAPLWCTAFMVLAIDTAARALEVILTKAGIIVCTGALPSDIEGTYDIDEEAKDLTYGRVGKVAAILSRFYQLLRSPTFECNMRRSVKRHCKVLLLALEARGVDPDRTESLPGMRDLEDGKLPQNVSPMQGQPDRAPEQAAWSHKNCPPATIEGPTKIHGPLPASACPDKDEEMALLVLPQPRGFGPMPASRVDPFGRSFRSDEIDPQPTQALGPLGIAGGPRRHTISSFNGADQCPSSPSQRFHAIGRTQDGFVGLDPLAPARSDADHLAMAGDAGYASVSTSASSQDSCDQWRTIDEGEAAGRRRSAGAVPGCDVPLLREPIPRRPWIEATSQGLPHHHLFTSRTLPQAQPTGFRVYPSTIFNGAAAQGFDGDKAFFRSSLHGAAPGSGGETAWWPAPGSGSTLGPVRDPIFGDGSQDSSSSSVRRSDGGGEGVHASTFQASPFGVGLDHSESFADAAVAGAGVGAVIWKAPAEAKTAPHRDMAPPFWRPAAEVEQDGYGE
ncbi:uncharacterized protein PFL1_04355 [Pseudozyma flocculosa PF-1]|uniref:Zn(2)-C6 fungal-type domain-containing protein n=1 Tax=Pseudozyma flocculosa PF-1 TaxID=1277687 RepID=A0A061H5Z7_9BASI|nr:uncharacterized protein PFL1_04355 [Pseudozyma flocculosa PF-1]EPQ28028.1 hypothetical protein PFL1_04355 [Pseudozyma flocculosa PF-1]